MCRRRIACDQAPERSEILVSCRARKAYLGEVLMSSELTKKGNRPAKPTRKQQPASEGARKWSAMKHGAYSGTTLLRGRPSRLMSSSRLLGICNLRTSSGGLCRSHRRFRMAEGRVRLKRKLEVEAVGQGNDRPLAEEPPHCSHAPRSNLYDLKNIQLERRPGPRDDYENLLRFSGSLYRLEDKSRIDFTISMLPGVRSSKRTRPPNRFRVG
jgi:hypothetical protein